MVVKKGEAIAVSDVQPAGRTEKCGHILWLAQRRSKDGIVHHGVVVHAKYVPLPRNAIERWTYGKQLMILGLNGSNGG